MIGFKLQNLSQSFESRKVLQNINLQVEAGEFVAVVGPSGCGKTTLLRLLADLQKPSGGEIQFSRKPKRAFVFQNPNLLAWRNVEENISLPLEFENKNSANSVSSALTSVHLTAAKNLFPHQLSGGMQMRTSLARALVSNPDLLLLDEPFSALDEISRFDLQIQLRKLWSEKKMTVLFVTHSLSEAVFLADRVLILKNGVISQERKVRLPESRTPELREDANFHHQVGELSRELRG